MKWSHTTPHRTVWTSNLATGLGRVDNGWFILYILIVFRLKLKQLFIYIDFKLLLATKPDIFYFTFLLIKFPGLPT